MNATSPTFKKGDKVYFGRTHGEQTLGEIVKVNPTKYKIMQLEARGSARNYKIGTIWTVPFNLVTAAPGTVATTPAATAPYVPVTVATCPVRRGDRAEFTKGRTVVTGTVKSVNAKTVTLINCDDNSSGYRVSIGMIRPATLGKTPVKDGAPTHAPKRTDAAILADIRTMYANLSPENLTCDGELTRVQTQARAAKINRTLHALFAEIGRTVSESEAYRKSA